jgi:UDP:flavonoid glycosyltransferase YjiC (YdhE family)
LDQAVTDKQDVVYLSIGSEAKWREWSVKALYHGLKKLGVKVVWSLKDFEIPVPDDPDFYVRPWIPQIEVLAHPAIKAGLTHCGFGGVNEFINASVPVIAWPHFADQHHNCELLEKAGVAIVLVNKMRLTKDEDATLAYVDVEFNEQKVFD